MWLILIEFLFIDLLMFDDDDESIKKGNWKDRKFQF